MTSTKKIIGQYCYFISHRLGDGVSSEVYRGFHLQTKQAVAIKIIPKAEYCRFDNISMAEAELHVLQELSGQPHILQLHFNTQTKNNIYIVTQLCQKGSLADVIKVHSKIPEAQALRYLKQLIRGYKAIADHQYVHRDIKPSNLLINAQDDIFIGDFGLCIKTNNQLKNQEGKVGSPYYMAPEIINPVATTYSKYTNKSDIWAIGITFYEMLNGKTPWKVKNESELIKSILSFQVENQMPSGLSQISEVVLKRSLCKNSQQRIGLRQMIELLDQEDVFLQQPFKVEAENENKETEPIVLQQCKPQPLKLGDHLVQQQHEIILPLRSKKDTLTENQPTVNSNQRSETVFELNRKVGIESSTVNHNQIKKTQIKSKVSANIHIQPIQKRYRKTSFQDCCPLELPSKAQTNKKLRKASEQINCEDLSEFTLHNKPVHPGKTLEELLTELESPGVKEKNHLVENVLERGDVSEIESGILKQLQGHINYFRLILKIWKKIKETLKVNDNGIQSFKTCLLHLFSTSLNQTRNLSHIKGYSSTQLSQFKQSLHYQSLIQMLDSYQRRYQRQLNQSSSLSDYNGERDFLKLLSYIMSILYQNIKAIENDQDELNRKKILVFILEDLIPLGKAFIISKQDNWQAVNKKLELSLHLKERNLERISIEYWKEVRDRFLRLAKGQSA